MPEDPRCQVAPRTQAACSHGRWILPSISSGLEQMLIQMMLHLGRHLEYSLWECTEGQAMPCLGS